MYNSTSGLEYKKFRVRGHIKSFRDLEVYKQTTLLASKTIQMNLEETLQEQARKIPKTIAKSYGEKFVNRQHAYEMIEQTAQNISELITEMDLIIALTEKSEDKEPFLDLIKKYQIQKRKILNLKKAWIRIEKKWPQTT